MNLGSDDIPRVVAAVEAAMAVRNDFLDRLDILLSPVYHFFVVVSCWLLRFEEALNQRFDCW